MSYLVDTSVWSLALRRDVPDTTRKVAELKRALEAAVENEFSNLSIDRNSLFKSFVRAVRRKCSTWEQVPDKYIKVD